VYILKETGEIVDNCQKRPASLFEERELSVDECADALSRVVETLRSRRPANANDGDMHVVLTVSPIRYAKYGYHASQLSKSTLLLATKELERRFPEHVDYFPAYEIVNDELRDYRFYRPDMLHPSEQAVEYVYQRFSSCYFSKLTSDYVREWKPVKQALQHRPFNAESAGYLAFQTQTKERLRQFKEKFLVTWM